MAEDLGKGDIVICVNNTPRANRGKSAEMCAYLTLNAQYTVRKICREGPSKGVHLEEIRLPYDPEIGYFAARFRRVSKNADFKKVLRMLKNPVNPGLPEGPTRTLTPKKTPEKVE
jgi:hypothetical protein